MVNQPPTDAHVRIPAGAGGRGLVGHVCLEPCENGLEMAIAVADDWQGRGVGRALLLAAFDWAITG